MDAEEARNNKESTIKDTKEGMFMNFTRDMDTIVHRRSISGHETALVTCETLAAEEAHTYILEKGYTVLDQGKSSWGGDTWFKIRW